MSREKIAIVGGGVSGLASAYYLSKKGFKVVLFEGSENLGGLVSGLEISEGVNIEKFYHHNFVGDKNFFDLMSELGIEAAFLSRKSTVGVLAENKFYDFNTSFDILKLDFLPLSSRILLGFGGAIVAFLPRFMLEGKTAAQICCRYLGKKNWDLFWQPLFVGKFGRFSGLVSAEWFASRLRSRLSSRGSGGENLVYPRGGYGVFLQAIQEKILLQGGEIFLGKKIENIEKVGSKYMIEGKKYDAVVTTIEPNHVPDIATFITKQRLSSIKYIGIINLLLITKKRLTRYYWTNILDGKAPFTGIIQHTNLVSEKEYGGNHIAYLTKYVDSTEEEYKKTDQQIYAEWTDYLEGIVRLRKEDTIEYYVSRCDSAQPIHGLDHKTPPYKLEENFYSISMAHIYPKDRGMEQAVAEAKKIVGMIISKS